MGRRAVAIPASKALVSVIRIALAGLSKEKKAAALRSSLSELNLSDVVLCRKQTHTPQSFYDAVIGALDRGAWERVPQSIREGIRQDWIKSTKRDERITFNDGDP
jgi:hypothetical protein